LGYALSPRARSDIREIGRYTLERWGIDQAEVYVRMIGDAVASVADDPRRGRSCDDVRAGYFKFAVGSHVIFYRRVGADIDVVRVLHGRMDFGRHL
jgi:toxin ParE1/3/4